MSYIEKLIQANSLSRNPILKGLYQKRIFIFFRIIGWPPRGCHLPLPYLDFDENKELMRSKVNFFDHLFLRFTYDPKIGVDDFISQNGFKCHCEIKNNGNKHLASDANKIWDTLSSRARNTIRKSLKNSYNISESSIDECQNQIHQLLIQTSTRKKFLNTFSLDLLKKIGLLLDKNDYLLMVAKYNNDIVAFSLFLIAEDMAIYYHGATDLKYLKTGVSSEIMYKSFVALSLRNIKCVDMNGLDDSGVAKWKKSFNLNTFEILTYEKSGIIFSLFFWIAKKLF